MHEHRHGKALRPVHLPEDVDADVEVEGTFFEGVHMRLVGEVAQLHVVDHVAGHDGYPSDLTIVGIIDFWDEDLPGQERPEEERDEEPELYVVESAGASGDGKGRR